MRLNIHTHNFAYPNTLVCACLPNLKLALPAPFIHVTIAPIVTSYIYATFLILGIGVLILIKHDG